MRYPIFINFDREERSNSARMTITNLTGYNTGRLPRASHPGVSPRLSPGLLHPDTEHGVHYYPVHQYSMVYPGCVGGAYTRVGREGVHTRVGREAILPGYSREAILPGTVGRHIHHLGYVAPIHHLGYVAPYTPPGYIHLFHTRVYTPVTHPGIPQVRSLIPGYTSGLGLSYPGLYLSDIRDMRRVLSSFFGRNRRYETQESPGL